MINIQTVFKYIFYLYYLTKLYIKLSSKHLNITQFILYKYFQQIMRNQFRKSIGDFNDTSEQI